MAGLLDKKLPRPQIKEGESLLHRWKICASPADDC